MRPRGKRIAVPISAWLQKGHVRLGFVLRWQARGILSRDNGKLTDLTSEKHGKGAHYARVEAADRRPIDEISFDQFDAAVVAQDTGGPSGGNLRWTACGDEV